MTWQDALTHLAYDLETSFDTLKYRLAERLDAGRPLKIVPYRGYGTPDKLYLKGRVLEDKQIAAAQGWIAPAALAGIAAEKEADAAAPTAFETLLGQEEKAESPTVVVDAGAPAETQAAVDRGALEEALETGDEDTQKPPTIVVKGDNRP